MLFVEKKEAIAEDDLGGVKFLHHQGKSPGENQGDQVPKLSAELEHRALAGD